MPRQEEVEPLVEKVSKRILRFLQREAPQIHRAETLYERTVDFQRQVAGAFQEQVPYTAGELAPFAIQF